MHRGAFSIGNDKRRHINWAILFATAIGTEGYYRCFMSRTVCSSARPEQYYLSIPCRFLNIGMGFGGVMYGSMKRCKSLEMAVFDQYLHVQREF